MRRAQGDERACRFPSAEALEKITRHQPTHRMADQHQLRIRRSRFSPPRLQPIERQSLESPRVHPVVEAPVVRKREIVFPGDKAELCHQIIFDMRVAVDFDQARNDRRSRDEARRGNPARVAIRCQFQVLDGTAT
jgi:hypothetical protein